MSAQRKSVGIRVDDRIAKETQQLLLRRRAVCFERVRSKALAAGKALKPWILIRRNERLDPTEPVNWSGLASRMVVGRPTPLERVRA